MTSPSTTPTARSLDGLLARRITVNWEIVAYLVIFAAAFALRFWDLGARALHHDESIHARWAWDFAQGVYTHDPTFHGPFLYVVQAFTFLVGNATDYISRISPALFGMAVVAVPLAMRRWLGPAGAFSAVAFLAFSPTLVYYSRFLRMDIYVAFFFLLMVVAMWSYLRDGRSRWLMLFAVALSLAFSTKEIAFIFIAFLLLYLNGCFALELARARASARPRAIALRAAALYPVAWVIAALWPFLGRLCRREGWGERGDRAELSRSGDLLVLSGTLTLPLLAAFARSPFETLFSVETLDYSVVCMTATGREAVAIATAVIVGGAVAAFAGIAWRPRVWIPAALAAALIYVTLMTSLWTNIPSGLCSGIWGSIDHWQAQQDVRRGMQPWFYYLMTVPAYEFLPLILALGGGVWALVKGSPFARFLVLWFLALFAALSFAGEKMPWLTTHLAIPAILIAGWTIQRAWSHWRQRALDARQLTLLAVFLLGVAIAFAVLVLDRSSSLALYLLWILLPLLPAAGALALLLRGEGRRILPILAASALIAMLAFFSVRTMLDVTFERGDVTKDMLIYTQSSPDITRFADDIDALADASGRGAYLRIAIDTPHSFAWPWVWYLRDYRYVTYRSMENGIPEGEFDVVLVHSVHAGIVADQLEARGETGFAPPIPYAHRQWYPETYKDALTAEPYEAEAWRQIGSGIFRGSWARDAFAFWRDHEPTVPLGSLDGVAYFPATFDRESGRFTAPDR